MNSHKFSDKDDFLSILSDKSAMPDARFIRSLRKELAQITSSKSTYDGLFGGIKHFVTVAVVSAVVLTGFTSVRSEKTPTASTSSPIDATAVITDTDVIDVTRQSSVQLSLDNDLTQESVDVDQEPEEAAAIVQLGSQSDPSSIINQADDGVENNADLVDTLPDDKPFSISYWNMAPFTTPPIIPNDSPDEIITGIDTLDFAWGKGSPTESGLINANHFVARATGTKYLVSGVYQLNLTIDDGVRVYINGDLVYDRWSTVTSFLSDQVQFSVYDDPETIIRIEYYESTGFSTLKVAM